MRPYFSVKSFILTAFVALLLATSVSIADKALAQPADVRQILEQQYTVLGITVEGNKSGSPETIIGQSGLRQGQKFTIPSDEVRRAVQSLWSQNIFSDVQVDIERESPQSDGSIGLFLRIRVTEFPKIGNVTIEGNDALKRTDVEKALQMRQFDFLRSWELEDARRRIVEAYQAEGHYLATVAFDTVRTDANTVNVTVRVNEGEEVVVRNIDFEGNNTLSDGELRGAMNETAEKRWYKIFTSGTFDREKYEADKKAVVAHYQSKGYRDARVVSDSIWVENGEDLNIKIRVSEGPQYRVRNIGITGNEVFAADEIRQRLGFQKGDVFDMTKFEMNMRGPSADFSDVGSMYYDKGYIVQMAREETVVAGDSIDITLRINEGKQHFFRYVEVQGNTKTKDYVIRRELYTRPGEPFSRSAIIRSIRQLAQLNYFNQEKLVPEPKILPDATHVDITYNVEERSSDTFNASVGYGGSLGFTGSVGLSFNNFDISDPFKGGGGQIFSITAEFGQSQYRTLSLSFQEPWLFQEPTTLGFSVYNTHQNYIYELTRTGASLSLGRRFKWPDDFFSGSWTLAGQKSDIRNGGGIYTTGQHDEVSIQQVISRVSTDNPVFPTSGSEFSLLNRLAYLPVESIAPNEPSNYFKNQLSMRFYNPMLAIGGTNKMVLATSAEIGQLGGVGSSPYVPPTERFTMGGSGLASGFYTVPLRGYDDASIGVSRANESGFPTGGLAYTKFSAELRYILSLEPIPMYLLTFAEAGNVWQSFSYADLSTLKRSLGVGARIQVPSVGLIGIDFGYGFDAEKPFGPPSGWKTHFQFGRGF
ncbi:MAG TPA: outer membrane protein assembly factor BamA [Candidatus Kapabacteria bacterium]|nr:outer membrane protein assembly factor BamA [Candidatus Kapabacteria bacterium]